jgi:hypothetical protein
MLDDGWIKPELYSNILQYPMPKTSNFTAKKPHPFLSAVNKILDSALDSYDFWW